MPQMKVTFGESLLIDNVLLLEPKARETEENYKCALNVWNSMN